MPKVSVILPTFNRCETLSRAIESVLAQTFEDFDLFIIDDGSTDKTKELVQSLDDPRVQYLYQKNQGVSSARNLGVKKSKGQWVALLDSDDEWENTRLEEQIDFSYKNQSLPLIYCEETWIRNGVRVNLKKKHKKLGGDIFGPSLKQCLIGPSASLIKRDLFLEVGLFDESFPICEDYELWIRVTSKYPIGLSKPAIERGPSIFMLSARSCIKRTCSIWPCFSKPSFKSNALSKISCFIFSFFAAVSSSSLKFLISAFKRYQSIATYLVES